MSPLHGSPAVDYAGASSFFTEQRVYPRPVSAAADLGAVEVVYCVRGPGNIASAILAKGNFRFCLTKSP